VQTCALPISAGGKERRDFVRDRRAWEVETPPMPLSWVQAFVAYLRSIGWGYDNWWCRDLGPPGNTVRARIDRASWSATSIDDLPGDRIVSFRVIEQGGEIMAWHSGKPADGDVLSASVRHIRENFAELEPLQPHIAGLVDLTALQ